ncbi:putative protein TPRXL, partial [Carcharodon carcharias]
SNSTSPSYPALSSPAPSSTSPSNSTSPSYPALSSPAPSSTS